MLPVSCAPGMTPQDNFVTLSGAGRSSHNNNLWNMGLAGLGWLAGLVWLQRLPWQWPRPWPRMVWGGQRSPGDPASPATQPVPWSVFQVSGGRTHLSPRLLRAGQRQLCLDGLQDC